MGPLPAWKQASMALALCKLFKYCVVITVPSPNGVTELCITTIRTSPNAFFNSDTFVWGSVPNNSSYLSYLFVWFTLEEKKSFKFVDIPTVFVSANKGWDRLFILPDAAGERAALQQQGNVVRFPLPHGYASTLSSDKDLFLDPRLQALWGVEGLEELVEQLDAYLVQIVPDLVRLFAGKEFFLLFQGNLEIQRELNKYVLSLSFELLCVMGVFPPREVVYLKVRMLEVGIDLRRTELPMLPVSLDREIAFMEKSLADFLPKLLVNFSPKQVQALLVYKNPSRVTHAIAKRICTEVWLHWYSYMRGPDRGFLFKNVCVFFCVILLFFIFVLIV